MIRKYINSRIDETSSMLGLDLPYFITGGFWLGFSMTATTLGGIFLSSLFARLWSKDMYGQFSFLTAALGFVSIISLPGMGQAVVQAVAEGKEGTYKYATGIVLRWSFIGTIILIFGSAYFYFRDNQNLALAVFIAALAFPINSAFGLFSSYLNGKKDFRKLAIFSTSLQLVSTIITSLALWKFSNLISVTLATTWSTALGYSFVSYLTFKKIENARIDKELVAFGKLLSIRQIMTLGVDYFDRFAIPLFLGFNQNAAYVIAILIPLQLQNFLKVFFNLVQPKLVNIKDSSAKKTLLLRAIQLEIPIILLVLLYIISAPTIFSILYPEYKESVFISQIFSLILLLYPATLFGLYMIKKRVVKEVFLSGIFYTIISIVSLIVLLQFWGLIGVVISKIFSRIVKVVTTQIIFNDSV